MNDLDCVSRISGEAVAEMEAAVQQFADNELGSALNATAANRISYLFLDNAKAWLAAMRVARGALAKMAEG